jgi:hypothetical protein
VAQKWRDNKLGRRKEQTPKRQKQKAKEQTDLGHFIIAKLVFIIGKKNREKKA